MSLFNRRYRFIRVFVNKDQPREYDYRTISEAIDDTIPGTETEIIVYPGLYNESLIIKDGIKIIGITGAIVESSDGCVQLEGQCAAIRNMAFRGIGKNFALEISQGRLFLENCKITSDSGNCIVLGGSKANPTFSECSIRGNIVFFENARGNFKDCDIIGRNKDFVAIAIMDSANPLFEKCRIVSERNCIGFLNSGGIFRNCDILGGDWAVFQANASPFFEECRILGEKCCVFVYSGDGIYRDCNITRSQGDAIIINGNGATLFEKCNIHRSRVGISCWEGRGIFRECRVFENDRGVEIAGGNPSFNDCSINFNFDIGLKISKNSKPVFQKCIVKEEFVGVCLDRDQHDLLDEKKLKIEQCCNRARFS